MHYFFQYIFRMMGQLKKTKKMTSNRLQTKKGFKRKIS